MKIFWQGRLIGARQAKAPVFGGVFVNGSALVETMRIQSGRPVNLGLHARRLAEGAAVLLMPRPDLAGFSRACFDLIRANHLKSGALRCRYFRDGSLLIHPLPAPPPLKRGAGIRLVTTAVRHYGPASVQGRVKANSMLPSLLARWETMALAEDGLRLTQEGYVAEGIWSNILVEKKGVLFSPPLSQGILEGTTRAEAMLHWKKRGGRVRERPLNRYDLYTADKVWLCSSLRGLMRVSEVDGRKVGQPM